ncbi:MAG: efflux RND transporter permease subunit [Myxococcaceae bacterium]|nr:efflux RND transporter permease subunit [Myxococcaceae bacterium]
MNISELSVRRGVAFAMVFLLVALAGLFSMTRLKIDLYPELTFPMVVTITTYEGASPEDIETLVSRPIEQGLAAVEGVQSLRSTSRTGVSVVMTEFDWGADMDQAETDVRRALDLVTPILPTDADAPIVIAMDPSLQPVLMVLVSGPMALSDLRRLADDDLCPAIERLPGVASAQAMGGLLRQINVTLDPDRVAAFAIDVNQVLSTIYQENRQEPGGTIEPGPLSVTLQLSGRYQSVEQIGEALVGMRQDSAGNPLPVQLKDIATIEDGFEERTQIIEVDGEEALWIVVRKQSGTNTVEAVRAVQSVLPELSRRYPGVNFSEIYNQADFIEQSMGNLASTTLIAIALSFLVLFAFLRSVRPSLVVALAIPFSLCATFFVMDLAGMTLNVISMAGLALAVGLVIDNSIVVLENVFRLRSLGVPLREASVRGASEVGLAVTASTLTTLSVFLPILFVRGVAGILFRDMAVTICFALVVSLVVSLSFVPLAASRWLRKSKRHLDKRPPLDTSDTPGAPDSPPASKSSRPHRRPRRGAFQWLLQGYGQSLDFCLAHRFVVVALLVVLVVLALFLATRVESDFMAQNDQSMIAIDLETSVNNNIDEAFAVASEGERAVRAAIPESARKLIALDIGGGSGMSAVFSEGSYAGSLRVPLVDIADRDLSQDELEARAMDALKAVPGLSATLQRGGPGGGQGGDLSVKIFGHDLDELRRLDAQLRRELAALPEIAQVRSSLTPPKDQLDIHLDRDKLAAQGLSSAAIGASISAFFQGTIAARYADQGDEFDIVVRYAPEFRKSRQDLLQMPIVTPSGGVMRLGDLATIDLVAGPVTIEREDQERRSQLDLTLRSSWRDKDGKTRGRDLSGAIASVRERLDAIDWPDGFTFEIGGNAEDFQESFQSLFLALMASIVLVFMVMAGQFESLRMPFIIIFTLPLALMGVVFALALTGTTVDVSALIGVILLVGIAVNNGIILVDAANRIRVNGPQGDAESQSRVNGPQGDAESQTPSAERTENAATESARDTNDAPRILSATEAMAIAGRQRLRPVLLTSLTTILAMIPLAFEIGAGSESWSGMARAVIGGLSLATLLTLFVTPVMYSFFARRWRTGDAEA